MPNFDAATGNVHAVLVIEKLGKVEQQTLRRALTARRDKCSATGSGLDEIEARLCESLIDQIMMARIVAS